MNIMIKWVLPAIAAANSFIHEDPSLNVITHESGKSLSMRL